MKFNDLEEVDKYLAIRIQEAHQSYSLIEAGNIAVDIGANIGGFTIPYHNKFKTLIAIEANKDCCTALESLIEKNKISNVVVLNKAVSDENNKLINFYKIEGEGIENHSGNGGTEWNEAEDYFKSKITEIEQISTINLETIHELYGFIDYMKIDCEGAEYKFLMNKDLSKIKTIVGEFHPGVLQGTEQDLFDHIRKTHIVNVYPHKYIFTAELKDENN